MIYNCYNMAILWYDLGCDWGSDWSRIKDTIRSMNHITTGSGLLWSRCSWWWKWMGGDWDWWSWSRLMNNGDRW